MKQFFLMFGFLLFSLFVSAQTIYSNQISWFSGIYERIDFYDEGDKEILTLAPRFYRERTSKKWIKPIKVDDQTYFVKRKFRFSGQSVYSSSGKHVANINKNGFEIYLVDEGNTYTLKPIIRLGDLSILECYNSEGELSSTLTWNRNRRLTFENKDNENMNLLLLSLCAHQYQELLLGDRGRLSAFF